MVNEDGTLKSNREISKIFLEKDIDTSLQIVNSCGSGMTACVNELAQKCVGAEHTIIYDGSWSEYGAVDEPDFDANDMDKAGKN